MPRPGPAKPQIAVRLPQEDIDWIDEQAGLRSEAGAVFTRSDVVREAIDDLRVKLALSGSRRQPRRATPAAS